MIMRRGGVLLIVCTHLRGGFVFCVLWETSFFLFVHLRRVLCLCEAFSFLCTSGGFRVSARRASNCAPQGGCVFCACERRACLLLVRLRRVLGR